jgi:hypothetical protein
MMNKAATLSPAPDNSAATINLFWQTRSANRIPAATAGQLCGGWRRWMSKFVVLAAQRKRAVD